MAQIYYYANLNEDNICIGTTQTTGPVYSSKSVAIVPGTDVLWRKHEDEQWSEEKFIPGWTIMEESAVEILLAEIAQKTAQIANLNDAVDLLILDALTEGGEA